MAELDLKNLKEGQTYLVDGNTLVEASFIDATGMWQLNETEKQAVWLVSPNGRLLGMQYDEARDVWLLDREPDIWTVNDLQVAGPDAPKLSALLRQAELTAQQKYGGNLTIMRVGAGWKAMYGEFDPSSETGRKQLQALPTYKTLYEALQSLSALT